MYLYNLTLQSPTSIVQAVYGNFSGSRGTEIMVARGKMLELLKPDESGRLESILRVDIFGVIRSMVPFRLTGAKLSSWSTIQQKTLSTKSTKRLSENPDVEELFRDNI